MNDYNERSIWLRVRAMLSLNDPRWGRGEGNGDRQRLNDSKRPPNGKDSEGPPDLDEMWRDFNRRLSRMFGRKGGGGGPRPDNGRGARIGVGIIIGVLVAIYLGSGVFVVQDGQAAAVLRFGELRGTAGQGVHWRMPYPFESHEIVNVGQVRSVEIGRNNVVRLANVKDASMLTHDADIVDVRFAVQYQIRKPTDYLFRSADADLSVTQAAQAAVRQIVGSRSTNDILYRDREAIRIQLSEAIQHSLDEYHTGLAVTGVTIQGVQPPDQVQAAFDDATKARQDRERTRRDAEAYASDLLPRAKAEGERMIADAKTYSERVVAQAEGDAERFKEVFAQYSKAPAVIRDRMYLETMQQIFSNTTKVFVDSKSGSNVLYLPLDKLVEQTRQRAAEAAAANPASAAQAVPSPQNQPNAPSAQGAAQGGNAPTIITQPAAPVSSASQAAAASDAFRSRDSFRSRGREDDLQ
ncbi:FtsH protease activity modulator HflK [Paraburkholderia phymatum]|uniref:Protein HflK n=1 Tax=Paraburkholderia phymatum (strain DSM 17167 / CIP 108236 / LMG 21445 / STM815) TaxID=391038 RepID=B2JIU4_PARP8|nr:FtsH protease activity modulator HflK [Paraburkholderia phymatum]ACC70595.1 HflK protein [Paraburkholderia phymatum STM815]